MGVADNCVLRARCPRPRAQRERPGAGVVHSSKQPGKAHCATCTGGGRSPNRASASGSAFPHPPFPVWLRPGPPFSFLSPLPTQGPAPRAARHPHPRDRRQHSTHLRHSGFLGGALAVGCFGVEEEASERRRKKKASLPHALQCTHHAHPRSPLPTYAHTTTTQHRRHPRPRKRCPWQNCPPHKRKRWYVSCPLLLPPPPPSHSSTHPPTHPPFLSIHRSCLWPPSSCKTPRWICPPRTSRASSRYVIE